MDIVGCLRIGVKDTGTDEGRMEGKKEANL
jgi:hypothetical protein